MNKMATIVIPEKHTLNRITEIKNLSDAKYYVFILLLSEMKCDRDLRSDYLNLVIHDVDEIEECQKSIINVYSSGVIFENIERGVIPYRFLYMAEYINKYVVEVEQDCYKLELPKDGITVKVESKKEE